MSKGPRDGTKGSRETSARSEPYNDGSELRNRIPGRRLTLIPHTEDPKRVFRFEFGPAILAQVREQLDILPIIPLVSAEAKAARYPGFYQLLSNGESKYIGRTIRPIGQRLREHIKKLRGRIPLEEIGCRFLYVEDLSLVGLSEDSLIAFFHPKGLDEWGKQGFGSKVTGHGRADQASAWHEAHPPNLSWPVGVMGRSRSLLQHVGEIAREAPITVSIPRRFKAAFSARFAEPYTIAKQIRTFAEWMTDLEHILHPDWTIDRKPMAWYIIPVNAKTELETDSET
jgi:hypothetical protein